MKDFHAGTLVAGLVFLVLGVVLLLDALDVVHVSAGILWPVALIGFGLSILATRTVGGER